MPEGHWGWRGPCPDVSGWKCGPFIFVGGQISADEHGKTIGVGDIEVQTRSVFENIRKALNEVEADLQQIVKFNTFYAFEGDGDEVPEYWKKMTKTRLELLSDPGPRRHRDPRQRHRSS